MHQEGLALAIGQAVIRKVVLRGHVSKLCVGGARLLKKGSGNEEGLPFALPCKSKTKGFPWLAIRAVGP